METENKEKQLTDCNVCQRNCTDPLNLSCGHVICADCFLSWMKTTTEAMHALCHTSAIDHKEVKIEQEREQINLQKLWRFSTNRGKNIVLKNDRLSAELCQYVDGIVMSEEPLHTNKLYEVQVEETNGGNNFAVGIVMETPANLDLQRYDIWMQSAIVILREGISVRRLVTTTNNGHALTNVKVGSRVGVLIDSAKCLHLYVDGIDQGVVYRGIWQACYAVFDLFPDLRKISALPVTLVPWDSSHIK